ncbi:MAG TPA: cation diffusion facilitator family transporter [Candidatus Methanomethylophilaceae archaeon]|nr:cation diffusion facilitator family transporter [Candidatus Methanomethylophilaceae archaeon]
MSNRTPGQRENFRFQAIIVAVGSFLMIAKFVAYFMTNSVAILTDAVESIVNIAAGTVGLYALFISPKPPDKDHPYGHGRAEVVSAAFEGAMILVAGIIIIISSIKGLYSPSPISDLDYGILIIFLAALVNLILGRTAIKMGKRNNSQALEASGRHLCTDTWDSFGIIIGLLAIYVGIYFGYDIAWLDPIIAMLFGAFILTTGLKILRGTIDTIMDRVDIETVSKITEAIIDNRRDEWIDVHSLRVMKYGTSYAVDLHLTLPRYLTVEEVEYETEKISEILEKALGYGIELTVKSEPCRDFSCAICTRDCDTRSEEFATLVKWTKDNIVARKQHRLDDE